MSLKSLKNLVQSLQSDPQWAEYRLIGRVETIWPEVVGEAVAKHTCPIRVQRHILQVATSTPAWAQTLMLQRPLILTKLNPRLSKPLKDIRFLPGEWHRSKPQLSSQARVQPGSPPQRKSIKPPAQTPQEAFERWQQAVRQAQATMATCPVCHRATPQFELDQWSMCGFCYLKDRNS